MALSSSGKDLRLRTAAQPTATARGGGLGILRHPECSLERLALSVVEKSVPSAPALTRGSPARRSKQGCGIVECVQCICQAADVSDTIVQARLRMARTDVNAQAVQIFPCRTKHRNSLCLLEQAEQRAAAAAQAELDAAKLVAYRRTLQFKVGPSCPAGYTC